MDYFSSMSRVFGPRSLLWFAATLFFCAAPALARRALSFAVPGDQIVGQTVARVLFTPQGSEHRVVFNFAFNPSVISYTGLAVGAGASGGSVALNTSQMGAGKVGELYNNRAGTARTGLYHLESGTEDGLAAGP